MDGYSGFCWYTDECCLSIMDPATHVFGQTRLKGGDSWNTALVDLTAREQFILFPTLALALILGICPFLVFDQMNASVINLVAFIQQYN